MSSSSYLELLMLKQAKLLKVLDMFESGVGNRSDFVNKILCGDSVSFNHDENALLKLSFIRDVRLECHNKTLIKLRDLCCGKYKVRHASHAIDRRRKHLKIKPFKCHHPDCGLSSVRQSYLQHQVVHAEKKRFRCRRNNCKFATKRRSYLRHHQAVHSSARAFRCRHENCTYAAKRRTNLQQHMLTLKIKPFKCHHPDCGLSFVSEKCLQKHQVVHDEKKRIRCVRNNSSEFATKHRSNLRSHQAVHSSVRAFRCSYENCSYAAKQRCGLENHMRTHSKARPYKCGFNGCGFATKYKSSLQSHVSSHKKR